MTRNLKRRSVLKTIGISGAALTFAGLAAATDGQARYIAETDGDANSEIESAGFEILAKLADDTVVLVKGTEDAADDLGDVRGVSTAVPDFAVEFKGPNVSSDDVGTDGDGVDAGDVYDEYLWDKRVQQVREAHEYATGAGQTVAVIDTGVDDTHPDLDVDVERSVTIVDGRPAEHTGDSGFHGTHVAGTIAGADDVAMVGTAPDATLVSVRVLGPDTGTFGDILVGMQYAGEIGATAANMSIGYMRLPRDADVGAYRQLFEPVANSVARDGTVLVGSGGNDETDLKGGWLRLWNGLAGVMGVSALTHEDELSYYSNYGTNDIDVGSPGGGYETMEKTFVEDPDEVARPWPLNAVFSTVPKENSLPDPYVDTTINGEAYGWLMGTSMAAPQVTGLAALVRELEPDFSSRRVENAIKRGAEGANGQGDDALGAGRTNALNTVESLD
ncbi:S8 family peptidase [Natronococcus wangiae]|uniref:S8 family peptidase n=1 Tax=Natronococcus wangiae TaxID=3068275 RepID=UPI00273FF643|nr:S8 family serine peptidase [Natronococcus sp. AD5]